MKFLRWFVNLGVHTQVISILTTSVLLTTLLATLAIKFPAVAIMIMRGAFLLGVFAFAYWLVYTVITEIKRGY